MGARLCRLRPAAARCPGRVLRLVIDTLSALVIRLDKSELPTHLARRVASRFQDVVALLLPLAVAGSALAVKGFNGEGQTGIVWQNETTKEFAVWSLERTNFVSAGWIPNDIGEGCRIAAVADFNRDGHPDLLWHSLSTGENEIWLMDGTRRIARNSIPASSSDFEVVGTGDFDSDGYPDIIWRDSVHNQTALWLMDGMNWNGRLGRLSNEAEFDWNLAAAADFNNDGYTDILWRDRLTGRNIVWFLRGVNLIEAIDIKPQPDLGDRLVGTGVFNLLGNNDLLWRHANGQNTVWLMSGTQYVGSATLPAVDSSDWQIGGAGGYTNTMRLSAIPDETLGFLTLTWRYESTEHPSIERRELGSPDWRLLATNYLSRRFTDFDLTAGQRYEYRVGGEYLLTGIAATPIEDRGRIILVVEQSLSAKIEDDLDLLKSDLMGDGWSVIRMNVPRHDDAVWSNNLAAIKSIKFVITNAYYQDPVVTRAVYLIGHVPIPYSGFPNPDGHGSRALPADNFYGDVDGIYTDNTVNFPSYLEGPAPLTRHDNFIGDGKFDQNRIPPNTQGVAELELAVGRVDFSSLPSFGALTEAELTRRYLRKTHRYRHKEFVLPDRVFVGTYFPFGPNRQAYTQALRIGSRLFGIQPGSVVEGDPFERENAALWGILGGPGLPFGITGGTGAYHQSTEMAHPELQPRLAFANVFASFCHDIHYPDNFMRAFLATPDYGLAIMWFKPVLGDEIPLAFETLGMGETIGAGFVRSINQSQRDASANMYVSLLGDPTLRLQVLAPPRTLPAESESKSALEWLPSKEADVNYFVYRSTSGPEGPWIRMTPTPIAETKFTDRSAPFGHGNYLVRAVKVVTTGSGSYTNLSQGIFFQQ